MSSLDDHHLHTNAEDCWCEPTVEAIEAENGYTRFLIIHNKVELTLAVLDDEVVVEQSGMTLEDSTELIRFLENQMSDVNAWLVEWWAVHEYAKLGS